MDLMCGIFSICLAAEEKHGGVGQPDFFNNNFLGWGFFPTSFFWSRQQ
jgi:hypothetical protein